MTYTHRVLWAFLTLHHLGLGQECICDDACKRNRACAFGSEEAYNYSVTTFFNFTGCPDCLSEPGNICECDDCNNTASDIQALLVNNFNTMSSGGGWVPPSLCYQPIMKAIMNFNTFPGDGRLENARMPLYQLCATSNGILQAGQCNGAHCHSQVPPVCEQQKGVSQMLRFLMSLFIIICVFLFTWASEENITKLFPSSLKKTNLSQAFSSVEYEPLDKEPVTTDVTQTASFFGAYL